MAAAELIREWRFHKRSHDAILYWHEGQLRAFAGQTEQAIELFSLARIPQDHDEYGWNYYIDGSIAYLIQDREILNVSVERYKTLVLKNREKRNKSSPDVKQQWPVNLRILIAFQKCFGKSYTEGYISFCNLSVTKSE